MRCHRHKSDANLARLIAKQIKASTEETHPHILLQKHIVTHKDTVNLLLMESGAAALNELLDAVISGSDTGHTPESQVKILFLILHNGLEEDQRPPSIPKPQWATKCLEAVETICDKNPLLVNHQVSEGGEVYYKWIMTILIQLLATNDGSVIQAVKRTMFTITHIITLKLRLLSYKLEMRHFFMENLETHIALLFKPTTETNLIAQLSICCNLFSVMTDPEVRRKLMLDSSYDQQLQSSAKKITYILTAADLRQPNEQFEVIKSHMLISLLNHCINHESITVSRLTLLVSVARELLQPAQTRSEHAVISTICITLLSLLKACLHMGSGPLFASALQVDTFSEIISQGPHNSVLSRVLALILFALDPSDSHKNIQSVHAQFQDATIERLRLDIIATALDEQATEAEVLPFQIDPKPKTIEQWLKLVRMNKSELSRGAKYSLLSSLGSISCIHTSSFDQDTLLCNVCSSSSGSGSTVDPSRPDIERSPEVKQAFALVLKNSIPGGDTILDMASLLSFEKFFRHFQPPKITSNDPTFSFVRNALASKNRDVRLLAVRLIPLYATSRHNIYDGNTAMIIRCANSFDLEEDSHLAESTIMIWGQLATVKEGTGLHQILLKLVDFLGSSNAFISSMAFHELRMICSSKKQSPWKMMSLVLPGLAATIAQRLSTKPAMGQKIADFLGVSVQTILTRYQADAVPYLLNYYKRDIIAEIGQWNGQEKLVVLTQNMPRILAHLLTSLPDPSSAQIHGILSLASPEFKQAPIELLFGENLEIVWELLQLHAKSGKSSELIMKSITFVAKVSTPKLSDRDAVRTWFEKHTLGLVHKLVDATRGLRGIKSFDEKVRSFQAIEFAIKLSGEAGSSFVAALPQVYTCVQSALETNQLQLPALKCWRSLCQSLEEQHLVSVLDHTISMILQLWSTFDHTTKTEAKKLLAALFDKSEAFRSKHIYTFDSIAGLDDLAELYAKVFNLIQKQERPGSLLADITRRCKLDNKYIVKQALADLRRFLTKYDSDFYNSFLIRPAYGPLVSSLIGNLLDILQKFKSVDEICIECSRCLGRIGALDPAKFEIERKKEQLVVASNFEDAREKVRFLLLFINSHLVPSFWASEDPKKQLFLAYAMQESLKACGLHSSTFDPTNVDVNSPEYALWSQFSEVSRSTLTPLVGSKYNASLSDYTKLDYPLFDPSKEHDKWVRTFTLDLLKRCDSSPAGHIFRPYTSLIREQDITISLFLLPYAALNCVVLDPNGDELKNITTEIITVLSTDINQVHHLAVQSVKLAYETIFNLLDYFRKWVFSRKQLLKRRNIKQQDEGIQKVTMLIDAIPQQLMAERSYQANSYERSALYLEQCLRNQDTHGFGDSFYGTLQNTYANIGDYDALDGVLRKFSTKSIDDRITELEYSENWKMAQDCLEALGEDKTAEYAKLDSDTRLLKSLFDHNLYDQTLEKLGALVNSGGDDATLKKDWLDLGLEASVLAGKYDHLVKWVDQLEMNRDMADESNLVYYHIGRALLSCKDDPLRFHDSLQNAFLTLGTQLALKKPTSLKKTRADFVLLHSLSDVETIVNTKPSGFARMKELLDVRVEHSGSDFQSNWVLSSVRRSCEAKLATPANIADIASTWAASSKSARKHNRLDLATSSIMHALQMGNQSTDLQYAKLLWAQGDHARALIFIEEMKTNTDGMSTRERASVQLKYTTWLDYTNNSSSTKIIEEYTTAIQIDPSWEKPYYSLARYYNKLLDLKAKPGVDGVDMKDLSGDLERRTISFYLKAIMCGTKYLFEAFPKVMTVWLDFAENVGNFDDEMSDSAKTKLISERRKNLTSISSDITKATERVPAYYWYTVFSQLLSRLLHPHNATAQQIILIAQLVVNEYPSQSLWSVLAQYKSTQKERERKARRILELFSGNECPDPTTTNSKILERSKKLFNQLISVSKKKIAKRGTLSLASDFDFDHGSTPSPLVVPMKKNFNITLPASVQALKHHNPFPNSSRVTIAKFENRVDILSSMQMPRHLYLRGSNGLMYGILCKPNDDLRKDAKLMEFTTMIDHLLKKDYESEQRKLHINTYAVIPLNEVYGIIEWVDHSRTMRDIIKSNYANINITLDIGFIKRVLEMGGPVSTRAQHFQDEIMAKYPPVMFQWFIENFPDPSSWYDARNNYTRTTAVMSMVGYMLGLGDRHGENLLLNEQNGGLLHVDFDCLFEKGLELAVPERVPFRLTRNMVDAFGVTGVEGTFRKSCEVTLNLIRANETILMNILESFLHDPIMDWSHKRKNKNTPQSALSTIRRKIRGILDKEGLPMSVPGQAEFLIQQATSLENLCQMYIGWMAFW